MTALRDHTEPIQLWMWATVALLAAAVYANSLDGQMFFDDEYAVHRNPTVTQPDTHAWTNALHEDYWGMPMRDARSHKSYRPLVVLTFRLNYLWGGLSPRGYHVVNVLFHALASVLVLPASRIVLRGRALPAWVAAMVFAVHPVHTEAVSGVVGRAEVMCFIFYLLAFLAGARAAVPYAVRWGWLCAACVAAAAATVCKETGITVMGVLFFFDALYVMDWLNVAPDKPDDTNPWVLRQAWLRRLLAWIPLPLTMRFWASCARQLAYVVFSVVFMTFRIRMNQGTLPTWPEKDNPAAASDSILLKVLNYPYIYWYNVSLLVFPWHLCGDYTFLSIPMIPGVSDPRNLLTLALILAVGALVWFAVRPNRVHLPILAALVLIGVPFLPSSNLFFIVGFLVAERVLYIPSLGFCVLVGFAADRVAASCSTAWSRRAVWAAVACLVAVLAVRTVVRNEDWRTEESFWASALAVVPNNGKVNFNLANAHFAKGEYPEAIKLFTVSLSITPDDPSIIINLATCYAKQGDLEQAVEMYERASHLATNLGQFYNWGAILEHWGDTEKAIQVFHMASEYNPEGGRLALYQDDHRMKAVSAVREGTLLCRADRCDEGLARFYHAVAIDDRNAEAWLRIGLEHNVRGEWAQAEPALRRALASNPSSELREIATAELQHGPRQTQRKTHHDTSSPSALTALRRRLARHPEDLHTRQELALALAAAGDHAAVIATLAPAARLAETSPDALTALVFAYAAQNQRSKAVSVLKRAAKAHPEHGEFVFQLGRFAHEDGDLERAVRLYKRAAKIIPRHDALWSNLGAAYERLGRPQTAIKALVRAHKIEPNNPDTLLNLAVVHRNLGDTGKALTWMQRAVEAAATVRGQNHPSLRPLLADLEALASHEGNADLLATAQAWRQSLPT